MKYFLFIISIAFLFSCGIDSSRKKKDRTKLIEELTKNQTDSLRVELDSICIETKEQQFEILVDSVLDVRLGEVKDKLKEYHKK